jgi:hypothetical protein
MNARTLVLLAGLVAIAWAFRRWRAAVQAVMVLVVFEGAIRKWLLPGAQDLVYFAKDILLIGAYAGYLSSGAARLSRRLVPPGLSVLLVASVVFGASQVVNPQLPTPLLGLLGFKAYFLYIPLLWVLPAIFSSDAEAALFLKRLLLLTIPVGLLGTAQFLSPRDSWLNTYARGGGENAISFGASAFVRVTGTFSFISGYASYLLANAALLLGVLATTSWKITSQLWVHTCLAFTVVGMLMTGSRGPVLSLILMLPLYWLLSLVRERQGGSMFGRFVVVFAVLAFVAQRFAPEAVDAFAGRARGATDIGNRFLSPISAPIRAAEQSGLLGFGIGATHQAASAVVRGAQEPYWLRGNLIEVEPGRVMLELGPFGFLIWYGARIGLIVWAFATGLRLRTRFHRTMAVAAALFLLCQLPAAAVFDPTASLYHWFIAALVPTMISLDRRVGTTAAQAVPTTPLTPDFSLPQEIRPIPSGSR